MADLCIVCNATHEGYWPDYRHESVIVPLSEIVIGRFEDIWPGLPSIRSDVVHALWQRPDGLLCLLHEVDAFRLEEAMGGDAR